MTRKSTCSLRLMSLFSLASCGFKDNATVDVFAEEPRGVGVHVHAGDVIQLVASGTWCWGGGSDCSDANGTTGRPNFEEPAALLDGAYFGALIGSVIGDEIVLIGSASSFTSTTAGEVQLGMNDAVGYYGDNSGTLSVEISVGGDGGGGDGGDGGGVCTDTTSYFGDGQLDAYCLDACAQEAAGQYDYQAADCSNLEGMINLGYEGGGDCPYCDNA